MPVYIRELTGAGNYVFKPDNLQKVVFRNETEIEGDGIYNSSIHPSYKGILLPWSNTGTYRLGEDAVLYMDEGNYFVNFGGFHFTLSDRVNGRGEDGCLRSYCIYYSWHYFRYGWTRCKSSKMYFRGLVKHAKTSHR